MTEAELWDAYEAEPGELSRRNRLVEFYLPLVKRIAQLRAARLPEFIDEEDLASAGVLGLLDAIPAFDRSRGVQFATFSWRRIDGAMLDLLRDADPVPRLHRQHSKMLEEAAAAHLAKHGRPATLEQLAAASGLSTRQAGEALRGARSMLRASLEEPVYRESKRVLLRRDELVAAGARPDDRLGRNSFLQAVCRGLGQQERLLLILYYFEGLTMRQIGASMDLSESRISQMHKRLIRQLKHRRAELRGFRGGE